jgi:hypothetical protein
MPVVIVFRKNHAAERFGQLRRHSTGAGNLSRICYNFITALSTEPVFLDAHARQQACE